MILIRTISKDEITESQFNYLAAVGFAVKDCGDVVEVWADEMAAV